MERTILRLRDGSILSLFVDGIYNIRKIRSTTTGGPIHGKYNNSKQLIKVTDIKSPKGNPVSSEIFYQYVDNKGIAKDESIHSLPSNQITDGKYKLIPMNLSDTTGELNKALMDAISGEVVSEVPGAREAKAVGKILSKLYHLKDASEKTPIDTLRDSISTLLQMIENNNYNIKRLSEECCGIKERGLNPLLQLEPEPELDTPRIGGKGSPQYLLEDREDRVDTPIKEDTDSDQGTPRIGSTLGIASTRGGGKSKRKKKNKTKRNKKNKTKRRNKTKHKKTRRNKKTKRR